MKGEDGLYSVTAPHYCCGFVVEQGVVVEAAPIIGWANGKTVRSTLDYFGSKGFDVEYVCAVEPKGPVSDPAIAALDL